MAIEAGSRVRSAAAHGKHGHSLISDAKFRQLFELALRMQRAGEREKVLRGREAALAGVAADLRQGDVVVAQHVASLEDITRGHVAVGMERRSFEERVIEALGDAVGDRMRKTGRITAIFFDATEASPVLREARTLAIAAKLPVLLVEHTARKRTRTALKKSAKKPASLEYPSIPVDTHDVIAMYRVAHESIERARDGGGPTHLVSVEWQPARANARKGDAKAETANAVEHLEEWLIARGLPAHEWRQQIVAGFDADRIDAARQSEEETFAARNNSGRTLADEETPARAIA